MIENGFTHQIPDAAALLGEAVGKQSSIVAQIRRVVNIIVILGVAGGPAAAAAHLGKDADVIGSGNQLLFTEGDIGIIELGGFCGIDDREGYFQVHQRAIDVLADVVVGIRIGHKLSNLCRREGGVFRHGAEELVIGPAVTRLNLFTEAVVAGKAIERMGDLEGGHEAGVKADDVKGGLCGVGTIDLREGGADILQGEHAAENGI